MGKGVSPESSERYSFKENDGYSLTVEERRDLFKESFNLSNYDALNYVTDYDATFGINRRSIIDGGK